MLKYLDLMESCPSIALEELCSARNISFPVYEVEYCDRYSTDVVCKINQYWKLGSGLTYDRAREKSAHEMYLFILQLNNHYSM